jgi:hypothetical protein
LVLPPVVDFDVELLHPATSRLAAVRTAIEALRRTDFIVTPCR